MPHMGQTALKRTLTGYYAATALFLVLDLGFGLNFRLSFLDDHDGWRLVYYGICFACLALIVLKPGWTLPVAAVESLVTMAALILGFGARVVTPSAAVLDGTMDAVTAQEVVNFLVSGFAAWLSWSRSLAALSGKPWS